MGDVLAPGQIVTSEAGRDKGQLFVVLGSADDRHVWVADGRARSVARPKKKNVRHLRACGQVPASLAQTLAAGAALTDREVRQAIEERSALEEAGA